MECYTKGQIEEARACWQKVIDLYTPDMGDDDTDAYADALNNMGYLLSHVEENYLQAFRYLTRARAIFASQGNWEDWAVNGLSVANLYHIYEDPNNAIGILGQTMSMGLKNKRWDTAVTAFSNVCRIPYLSDPGLLQQVDNMRRELIASKMPPTHPYSNYAKALERLSLDWKTRDYDHAALMADRARTLVPSHIDSARMALGCLFLKAHSQRHAGRTDMAKATTEEILKLPGLPSGYHFEALVLMSDLCKDAGQSEQALRWLDESRNLEDSVIGNQRYSLLRDTEHALQTEEYEASMNIERQARERLRWWLWTAGAFIVVLASCGWVILRQNRRLREKNRQLFDNTQTRRPQIKMDEAKEQHNEALMERIRQAIADPSLASNPDLTVQMLAEQLGMSARVVSKTINTVTGDNFSTLLARTRVAMACEKLRDPATHNLTLEALGQSLGFRSRSNFAVVFRKITGLTLSEYRKMASQ